jgi:hypothetical protein
VIGSKVTRAFALALTGAMLAACFLSVPSVKAATAGPQWSITVRAIPTVFSRVDEPTFVERSQYYEILAKNLGEGPSEGSLTVTDVLPDGVKIPEGAAVIGENRNAVPTLVPFTCAEAGQTVTCEGSEPIPSGESAAVIIPVEVVPTSPDRLIDTAEVSGGGAPGVARATDATQVGGPPPTFGFLEGSSGLAANLSGVAAGAPAGGHPYQATFRLGFPLKSEEGLTFGIGEPKRENVILPRGMYADPGATAKLCTEAELESEYQAAEGCPRSTQVGVADLQLRFTEPFLTPFVRPVFNMVPPPGAPAELAFEGETGVYVHLSAHVRSNGEYELSAAADNTPAKLPIGDVFVSLWGSPTDASHDPTRGQGTIFGGETTMGCIGRREAEAQCPTERLSTAFLTLPDDCPLSPLAILGEVSSWRAPSVFDRRTALVTDLEGDPITTTGCGSVAFDPSVKATPTTDHADSPTGLDFDLHQPQQLAYAERATANLKDAEVTLPEGVTLDPSAANGLTACTEDQIGYAPQEGKIRFSEDAQSCPNSAKIGTVSVSTPLLGHKLPGAIYVAKPYDNPFGSLLSIYLAIEDEESGIVSKLAGKVTPDPQTGRLTANFTENPELPLEDIELHFFEGPGAALKTPLACGTGVTTSSLVPWSTPEGATAHPSDPFATRTATSGSGPCPVSEAGASFAPAFAASTVDPLGGSYSPFVLRLSRNDGEQHLTGIDTTLPKGLLGRLAGIPYCSEAQIAAARSRETPQKGALEASSPSCPAASEVGTVTIGAGAGSAPYYVNGHAYLAGPYKGAPLSLVVITPAVAGPFDLGVVVTRVALDVDPFSAQIDAVSDPLPTILDGIPLDLRSIALKVDRPNFIVNPTSCQEKRITGSVSSQAGGTAALLNRFQVGGCDKLKFKPTLQLGLDGSTKRTGHPALKAVLTYPKEGAYANIARAQVNLPHAEFLDQNNLNKTCTRPVLIEGRCPKSSIYGKAKAWSPLLEKPLEGPVYLVGGFGYKLPALVAELNGQIRVLLKGKVDSGPNKGIRTTFEAVPDAPVSRFVLELKGGPKYSLLENSENLCRRTQKASARFTGQNGVVEIAGPRISRSCGAPRHKTS